MVKGHLVKLQQSWPTVELNSEKKQDPFYSEEYNIANISKGNAFLLQCLTNDLQWVTSHNTNQTGSFPLHHPQGCTEQCWVLFALYFLSPPQTLTLAVARYPDENSNNPKKKVRRRAGDDGKREKAVPLTNSQTGKTVNTRNISGMLLCCKEKANQARESTKPQPRTLISWCFFGQFACPDLCSDWSQHNKHSWNISSVHCFLGLTVNRPDNC